MAENPIFSFYRGAHKAIQHLGLRPTDEELKRRSAQTEQLQRVMKKIDSFIPPSQLVRDEVDDLKFARGRGQREVDIDTDLGIRQQRVALNRADKVAAAYGLNTVIQRTRNQYRQLHSTARHHLERTPVRMMIDVEMRSGLQKQALKVNERNIIAHETKNDLQEMCVVAEYIKKHLEWGFSTTGEIYPSARLDRRHRMDIGVRKSSPAYAEFRQLRVSFENGLRKLEENGLLNNTAREREQIKSRKKRN